MQEQALNNKTAKQKRIINAATSLFTSRGFNDTSMLEIAKNADVADGNGLRIFQLQRKPFDKHTHGKTE
ncbi:MAG: TetR/AcrR family transcriptional regulator [Desulfobacterium sp.]|nr:TetR/AcrR family transcriptional regulator [Desulfobacterium sp.]